MNERYQEFHICGRYRLPHGIGILLGYESIFVSRDEILLHWGQMSTYSLDRHIFRLEPGHTWAMAPDETTPLYFCRLAEVEQL